MSYSFPPPHDMHMHTNPTCHVNGSYFISQQGKDPTVLQNVFQSMQHHRFNVFTHLLPTSLAPLLFREIFHIQIPQQVLGFTIINHWATITKNLKHGWELNSLSVSLAHLAVVETPLERSTKKTTVLDFSSVCRPFLCRHCQPQAQGKGYHLHCKSSCPHVSPGCHPWSRSPSFSHWL
jgi:hypothetical protein